MLVRAGWRLASEAVDGSSLALEGVDDVEGGDGLAASVLGVGDGVTDDGLEEGLQDAAALLVDESRNALDSSTAGETTDGGLGDSLDVVPKDLAMAFGSSLAESLSSFTSSGHVVLNLCCVGTLNLLELVLSFFRLLDPNFEAPKRLKTNQPVPSGENINLISKSNNH